MKKHYKFYSTLFIVILCFITTLISVGFGALNKNLSISGEIEYEIHDNSPTLYNVLKTEALLGTYAKKYTGSHHDSFTAEPTKNVYHWSASNDTNANAILDKWNVRFAGFCWQMIRTTDTGGVRLIYNGTPTSGKCNNTGSTQQIGTSTFNPSRDSLADVGYMYNIRYLADTKSTIENNVLTKTSMAGYFSSPSYYYGTGVTYSNGTYTLTGTTYATWDSTYSSSGGLYTCASKTDTTCSTVYYIVGGTSTDMYGFEMTDGHLLNYYNTNIVLGTAYTESNGTYTLTNTTTITKEDWFGNHPFKNYYVCGNNSTTCTDLGYVVSAQIVGYYTLLVPNNYIYANSFTYNSGTNKYTLSSDRYQSWNMTDTDIANLATHHYTCFNTTGTCQTLSYVNSVVTPSTSNYMGYINLTGGKSIGDALDEMLYNNNVNTTASTIKTYIDNWYRNNMTSYTSKLENTIFCYNRTMKDPSTNVWNPNGGGVSLPTTFFEYDSLICSHDTDKFSVSNNKAKLTYPVGLPTYQEMKSLYNGSYLLSKTGQYYWLGSPNNHASGAVNLMVVFTGGSFGSRPLNSSSGVRPVVSLKPNTQYSSGTGSKDDPYVVQ